MDGTVTEPSAEPCFSEQPAPDGIEARVLLDEIDAIVWSLDDRDSRSRSIGHDSFELLGHSQSAWSSPGFWCSIVHTEDRSWVCRRHSDALERGESHVLEYRLIAADGRERWVRDRVRALPRNGDRLRARGLMLDITGEKLAEQALREQRDLSDAILDSSESLIILLDREGVVRRANRACERLMGDAAHTLVGRRFDERFADPADQPLARILLQRVGEGRAPSPTELRTRRADGSQARVSWSFSALREPAGRISRVVASGLDLTERAASEERSRDRAAGLRHAQKMEAIGRLASGVSHEFNNLFTALLGFTQALEFELRDDPRCAPLTDGLRETLEHATSLTAQLRSMGRRDPEVLRPLDLAAEVAARTPLLRRLLGEELAIELDLSGAGAQVLGDPGQLQQVLLNLVLNARDAMPEGGRVRVGVHRHAGPAGRGSRIELSVRDHGAGMDEETRARIFEPFFSTKGDAGSGLGLMAVYAISRQWGGEVVAESEPGRGTCMRVSLPEWTKSLAPVECTSERLLPKQPARLLFVEDEPRVRRLMLEALRRDGHEVLEAGDGREALALARSLTEPLDLLVTDVMMPRMGGRELARALRALRPGIRVLFISGYPDDAMLDPGDGLDGADYLQKPFPPAALTRRVRELLADREAGPAAVKAAVGDRAPRAPEIRA